MKRLSLAIVAAALLAGSVGLVAHVQSQNFTLVNQTGLTIAELYLSPTKEKTWGDDILGEGVLEDNHKMEIKFHHSATACHWDMKVVDSRKSSYEWSNINLCEECDIITIKYDADTKETSAFCKTGHPATR